MKNKSRWLRNLFVGVAGLAGLIAIMWVNTFTLVEESRWVGHSIVLSLALLLIFSSLPPIRSRFLYSLKSDYGKVARSPFLRRFLVTVMLIGYPGLIWATAGVVLVPINCILDRSKAICEEMKVVRKRYDAGRYSYRYACF